MFCYIRDNEVTATILVGKLDPTGHSLARKSLYTNTNWTDSKSNTSPLGSNSSLFQLSF